MCSLITESGPPRALSVIHKDINSVRLQWTTPLQRNGAIKNYSVKFQIGNVCQTNEIKRMYLIVIVRYDRL